MSINKYISLFIVLLVFSGCRKDPKIEPPYDYSFFSVGHAYGSPLDIQHGIYSNLVNHFSFLNQYKKLEFGVFTGDVVYYNDKVSWDSVFVDFGKLTMPYHIAAGNHDRGALFETMFTPYYTFKKHNDLFIILNTDNWDVVGEQKTFLETTIQNNYKTVNNIFIFTHELIWWEPDNLFGNIKINYLPNYPGDSNYWEDIFPILDTLSNNVVMIAGDLGCIPNVTPYMYYKENNITYIANGVGSGDNDNVIIVEVDYSGKPHFKLYGLNDTIPYIIEDLESYILP